MILDGHFSHEFVVKICTICLKRPDHKRKRGRGWPILKKIFKFYTTGFGYPPTPPPIDMKMEVSNSSSSASAAASLLASHVTSSHHDSISDYHHHHQHHHHHHSSSHPPVTSSDAFSLAPPSSSSPSPTSAMTRFFFNFGQISFSVKFHKSLTNSKVKFWYTQIKINVKKHSLGIGTFGCKRC